MTVHELIAEMRRKADATPCHDNALDFRRDAKIDGYAVNITFTRTVVGRREFYQLSMGNDEGDPSLIPPASVEKLRAAFVPDGLMIPSPLGNCR